MSSGVDSSVAAALLQKEGYEVIGLFMHFWKEPDPNEKIENKCCSLESHQDARRVAQKLKIPLYTLNAATDFKKSVVDFFLSETCAGRTPNPCVECNRQIKFTFMFQKMLEMEADFVASGHYADIKKIDGKYHLFTSYDDEKDQTYFLYNFKQADLGKIIFPLAGYKKTQVRQMAKEMGLPVFDKDDSQGLCFTREKYPTNFLKRNLKLKSGNIVDGQGRVIGQHEGLELYTIGQRRGINIGGTGPYYVVARDFAKNELIVTNQEDDPGIFYTKMKVEDVNWIAEKPKFPLETNVKIRYRHPLVRAIIKKENEGVLEVEFFEPQKVVTPGQSAVFYSDQGEVLGGGIINLK